jgi:hypothetical protein
MLLERPSIANTGDRHDEIAWGENTTGRAE